MDAPPTTAGTIPGPRADRLPAAAKTIAWLDAIFGTGIIVVLIDEPELIDLYSIPYVIFLPLGIGLLLRWGVARFLARVAHTIMGGMLVLGLVFTFVDILTGGATGQWASGGRMLVAMALLVLTTILFTAFFVWGFFVLGRKDVRAACRRNPE